ncbi:hypothetical protein KKG48_02875 [Patescibacteria group bacterium]|nr:hypothetical protein [Patescibacteria group bacterium]MCG2694529.1 hypothetical protein [Candidatus Parcubacteria bacterium]
MNTLLVSLALIFLFILFTGWVDYLAKGSPTSRIKEGVYHVEASAFPRGGRYLLLRELGDANQAPIYLDCSSFRLEDEPIQIGNNVQVSGKKISKFKMGK